VSRWISILGCSSIRLTLDADYTDVMIAGNGDDAFAILSEQRGFSTEVSQTVITCGD
jgi:hypothetical protein